MPSHRELTNKTLRLLTVVTMGETHIIRTKERFEDLCDTVLSIIDNIPERFLKYLEDWKKYWVYMPSDKRDHYWTSHVNILKGVLEEVKKGMNDFIAKYFSDAYLNLDMSFLNDMRIVLHGLAILYDYEDEIKLYLEKGEDGYSGKQKIEADCPFLGDCIEPNVDETLETRFCYDNSSWGFKYCSIYKKWLKELGSKEQK